MNRLPEGLGCFRGILIALPIGILMWVGIICGIMTIVKGCHKKPEYESVGGKFEVLVTNIIQDIK